MSDFEKNMQREINAFLDPKKGAKQKPHPPAATKAAKPRPAKPRATSQKTGYVVKLAVRTKPIELDTVFEHRSSSISKFEAQLEAEKAARKAGYPIIGYVIDVQRL
ncbi:hypothetical protein [Litchfieldella qijiaojingensis]|uniref:hypothetical protein n=1 Tax=Litchfieldella qijiaojingensis TaxID=980347 RepID=UPI0016791CB3|nr:hypothetical protein [Halomonas qijiaojingensis]